MIPAVVIESLEKQVEGVTFGKICLEISVHDNNAKYRIVKEISVVPEKKSSGGAARASGENEAKDAS